MKTSRIPIKRRLGPAKFIQDCKHHVGEQTHVEAIETRKRSYLKDFVSLPDSAEALFTGAETGARACGSIKAHFHGHQENLCSEPCNTVLSHPVFFTDTHRWQFWPCRFLVISYFEQLGTVDWSGEVSKSFMLCQAALQKQVVYNFMATFKHPNLYLWKVLKKRWPFGFNILNFSWNSIPFNSNTTSRYLQTPPFYLPILSFVLLLNA